MKNLSKAEYKVVKFYGKNLEIPQIWQINKLKDLLISANQGVNTAIDKVDYVLNGYPLIKAGDIRQNLELGKTHKISGNSFQNIPSHQKPAYGDILYANIGSRLGTARYVDFKEDSAIAWNVFLMRVKKTINSLFLNYYLNYTPIRNILTSTASIATMPFISKPELLSLNVIIPTLIEQQKIAYILSKVDELIQKTDQIIEQTQRLKKGLMQRLLTKGIGHNNFKMVNLGINFLNYKIPSEWRLLRLGNLASVHGRIGWKGLKREEYTESGPLMLSVWSLIDNDAYGVDYSAGVNRLSKFRYDESPEIKLQNGDVLLAKDGDIGRVGYVKSLLEPSTVNSHVVVVRTKSNEIESEFLYWYMNSHPFQAYCKSMTSGTTVPLLSQSNIRDAIIPIPIMIEQKTICSFLYSFSNIIYKYKNYKNNLKGLKKGLMQKLLTGKIRVKI
jgi:type I restriction enzyme S subunit